MVKQKKYFSKETREKISKALTGKKLSKETIAKRTETRKKNGWFKDIEERNKKMMVALCGRIREDVSKRMMGNNYNKLRKNTSRSKETREKISKALTGKKMSKKARENMSQSAKEAYAKGTRKKIAFNKIRVGHNKKVMKNGVRKRKSHWAWFEYYGHFPEKGAIIHHIDGDEENNNISNLQLMTRSQHTKLHWELINE